MPHFLAPGYLVLLVFVAASIGPYGAMLADGSEYRGRYGVPASRLRDFHGPRLELLASASPDLLAVGHLEHELVVHLHDHPRRLALAVEQGTEPGEELGGLRGHRPGTLRTGNAGERATAGPAQVPRFALTYGAAGRRCAPGPRRFRRRHRTARSFPDCGPGRRCGNAGWKGQ